MRSQVLIAAGLSVALLSAAGLVSPAHAQLQWQSTGVRQATHTQPEAPQTAAPVRQAKAPTTRRSRPSAQPAQQVGVAQRAGSPVQTQTPVQQPVVQAAVVDTASRLSAGAVRYDGAVSPVCHDCGCGNGGCGCVGADTYYEEGPSCGIAGCGDVACGLTCGEACGCGDIGCAGECGMTCGCGDTCTCGVRSLGGCDKRGAIPLILYLPPIQELTVFGGVQAFKNPLDGGRDRGNFGFHEGLNLGGRMAWLPLQSVGYQIGYQATHNQLHGDDTTNSSDPHTQQFVTAGLFRRKPVGLQYGLVYDMLRDERQGSIDFNQVRGLVSITNPCGHEFGFSFTSSTNVEEINELDYKALDQYLLFYRKHGPKGGELRVFGGFTDESKGIFGGDVSVPLNNRWSLETGFTYVIPEEDRAGLGAQQEAWNIGANLVWHFGKRAKRCYSGQFRPMFGVADNGSLIVSDVQ